MAAEVGLLRLLCVRFLAIQKLMALMLKFPWDASKYPPQYTGLGFDLFVLRVPRASRASM